MSSDLAYTLGTHAAKLESIEKRVEAMDSKLDCTIRYIEQQKGERKGIIRAASAISGTISALVTAALMKLFHIGGP